VRLSANENHSAPRRARWPRSSARPRGSTSTLTALERAPRGARARPRSGANQIVVGNGADELIALIAAAAFEPGDEVVVPALVRAYGSRRPSQAPASWKARWRIRHRSGRRPAPGHDRTKAYAVLTHNPATTIIHRGPFLAFLDALGPDSPLVVLDQAYTDSATTPTTSTESGSSSATRASSCSARSRRSRGSRPARGLCGRERRDDRPVQSRPCAYNVNRLGQVAALAALEDHAHIDRRGDSCSRSARTSDRADQARLRVPALARELPAGRRPGRGGAATRLMRRDPGPRRRRHRLSRSPAVFVGLHETNENYCPCSSWRGARRDRRATLPPRGDGNR